MSVAALQQLKPAQPRKFVPARIDLGEWAQLEPLFTQLRERGKAVKNAKALEKWVLDVSELAAALEEDGAKRYITMTCHTDDAAAEKAYLHFIEEVEPKAKPQWNEIEKIFLASPYHKKLPQKRWGVFKRKVKNNADLFRAENVALDVEDSKLAQQFQKLNGAMTIEFQGKEYTLQQMGRFLEDPDRSLRQQAWEKIAERRLRDKDKLEDIFDALIKIRTKMAKNAGFKNYRDYAFKMRARFDYTPRDCEKFHAAVEKLVVPIRRALQQRRQRLMRVDALRPWDMSVDPKNRTPLRPFEDAGTLVQKCQNIFNRIDKSLGKDYSILRDRNLLDLDSRKGKAPGGYQCSLEEARLPFIFMNAVGLQRDVETMLHEAGHAFHALAARKEPLLMYRSAPIEFCEVASMGMELLAAPYLSEFYSDDDAARAQRTHLEGIIATLPWVATVDAFQHWIYTHPDHSRDERRKFWRELHARFGGIEDYSGYETALDYLWHRQLHIFIHPFYYIEYGIAQLGALQLWLKACKDRKLAVKNYRTALSLGGSRPLPDLFKAAKLKFDFGPKTVQPLVKALDSALKQLEHA